MGEEDEMTESQQNPVKEDQQDCNVLRFLDSLDTYLLLIDSLSSTLRQGWLELASARHSMGVSRINSALFDLKHHNASTTLEVNDHDAASTMKQPDFTLHKWASPDNDKKFLEETKCVEDESSQRKSSSQQLRHRGSSQNSEIQEKGSESSEPESNVSLLMARDQVQKERSKSLSKFGGLVSPKLQSAQLSFETALEALVEIANVRSSMLHAYDQVKKEMENTIR